MTNWIEKAADRIAIQFDVAQWQDDRIARSSAIIAKIIREELVKSSDGLYRAAKDVHQDVDLAVCHAESAACKSCTRLMVNLRRMLIEFLGYEAAA